LADAWPTFIAKRNDRLAQERRFGTASEKVAENILEDLFTTVLDWSLTEVNNQVHYADLVLTRSGIKHLLIEVKRPGALVWGRASVAKALDQARGYADEQKVPVIAVSDGVMIYACDLRDSTWRDRVFARLDQPEVPLDLWWLSKDGIYRKREDNPELLPNVPTPIPSTTDELRHHKYDLPARCFAYVGDATDTRTWRLPYLLADGTPDRARLPKAIQAILSNYRGEHVSSVPEPAIPEVLVTLARTARDIGKLPVPGPDAPTAYVKLQAALDQLGRLAEIASPTPR
jgi:hypothetical protein